LAFTHFLHFGRFGGFTYKKIINELLKNISCQLLLLFLAQMKRIHCEEKQEQQTPKAGGMPPCARNLN